MLRGAKALEAKRQCMRRRKWELKKAFDLPANVIGGALISVQFQKWRAAFNI